ATIAKSKGLEPLADFIIALPQNKDILAEAKQYINEEKEVMRAEDALEGAKYILAERISDEPEFRRWIRQKKKKKGTLKSAAKDAEA
ncbi:RNA-binding transcriptional accessory protein, partial [Bacillus atrophaeus]